MNAQGADDILRSIRARIREIVRRMTAADDSVANSCLRQLDSCLTYLNTTRGIIESSHFTAIESSINSLRSALEVYRVDSSSVTGVPYSAPRPLTGARGRPEVVIQREQLVFLRDSGFSAVQIARQLGCSASLIYKRLTEEGLQMRNKYSSIAESELDDHVRKIRENHENAGNEMSHGYLRAAKLIVQRYRVRDSLRRVDPLSSASRWSRTVTRRTYSVATPNSLWHLDSHMKLVRWGFVTHGCVDGYSRVITFLKTATTNEAKVVLHLFVQACSVLGVPSRVRCDQGGENVDVAMFMTLLRGSDRGSIIAGRSVHNQRIERMWRDVATQVTEYFYKLFYEMEDESLLDVGDDIHLCALQLAFLPLINDRMSEFRSAWNNHRLRTERNRSPQQLWFDGMLQNMNSDHVATAEVFLQQQPLEVRIYDALQSLNIDIQPFMFTTGLAPATLRYTVDATSATALQNLLVGITDMKMKYRTAVQFVQNMHGIA